MLKYLWHSVIDKPWSLAGTYTSVIDYVKQTWTWRVAEKHTEDECCSMCSELWYIKVCLDKIKYLWFNIVDVYVICFCACMCVLRLHMLHVITGLWIVEERQHTTEECFVRCPHPGRICAPVSVESNTVWILLSFKCHNQLDRNILFCRR